MILDVDTETHLQLVRLALERLRFAHADARTLFMFFLLQNANIIPSPFLILNQWLIEEINVPR